MAASTLTTPSSQIDSDPGFMDTNSTTSDDFTLVDGQNNVADAIAVSNAIKTLVKAKKDPKLSKIVTELLESNQQELKPLCEKGISKQVDHSIQFFEFVKLLQELEGMHEPRRWSDDHTKMGLIKLRFFHMAFLGMLGEHSDGRFQLRKFKGPLRFTCAESDSIELLRNAFCGMIQTLANVDNFYQILCTFCIKVCQRKWFPALCVTHFEQLKTLSCAYDKKVWESTLERVSTCSTEVEEVLICTELLYNVSKVLCHTYGRDLESIHLAANSNSYYSLEYVLASLKRKQHNKVPENAEKLHKLCSLLESVMQDPCLTTEMEFILSKVQSSMLLEHHVAVARNIAFNEPAPSLLNQLQVQLLWEHINYQANNYKVEPINDPMAYMTRRLLERERFPPMRTKYDPNEFYCRSVLVDTNYKLKDDDDTETELIMEKDFSVESRLRELSKDLLFGVITPEYLKKYGIYITGGIMSLIFPFPFQHDGQYDDMKIGDVDLICSQANIEQAALEMENLLRTKPVINETRTKFKFVVSLPLDKSDQMLDESITVELFCHIPPKGDLNYSHERVIQSFHFACVRAWHDGTSLKCCPTYIVAAKSRVCYDTRYVVKYTNDIFSLTAKYLSRGYFICESLNLEREGDSFTRFKRLSIAKLTTFGSFVKKYHSTLI